MSKIGEWSTNRLCDGINTLQKVQTFSSVASWLGALRHTNSSIVNKSQDSTRLIIRSRLDSYTVSPPRYHLWTDLNFPFVRLQVIRLGSGTKCYGGPGEILILLPAWQQSTDTLVTTNISFIFNYLLICCTNNSVYTVLRWFLPYSSLLCMVFRKNYGIISLGDVVFVNRCSLLAGLFQLQWSPIDDYNSVLGRHSPWSSFSYYSQECSIADVAYTRN